MTYLKIGILGLILLISLYYDIREQKIKNFITFPAALVGISINFIDQGYNGLITSLTGWFIPIAGLILLYYINVMGAGDIKLFAAIGSVMGLTFVAYSFIFSIYIGGIIAVFLLIKRRVFKTRMIAVLNYLKFIFLTGRLNKYSAKEDHSSKFIFTSAIVPGTLVQLALTYFK